MTKVRVDPLKMDRWQLNFFYFFCPVTFCVRAVDSSDDGKKIKLSFFSNSHDNAWYFIKAQAQERKFEWFDRMILFTRK